MHFDFVIFPLQTFIWASLHSLVTDSQSIIVWYSQPEIYIIHCPV